MAFHIQSDWDNYGDRVAKEDRARIQAHYDAEEKVKRRAQREADAAEFRQREAEEAQRLEEEKAMYQAILSQRKEDEERKRSGKQPLKKRTPAEKAAIAYNRRRTKELAVPKVDPQPQYGGTMFGKCMYQSTRRVEYPQGRAGQPYCPGIDRDRIIPARHDPSELPPWIGSYSSHNSILSEPMQRKMAAEEANYYCGAPQRTGAEDASRRAEIDAILKGLEAQEAREAVSETGVESPGSSEDHQHWSSVQQSRDDKEDDVTSIFSHAESNGPIVATGAKHLAYNSTRAEVSNHLRAYGGAITRPMHPYQPETHVKDMNLPQLQERVVQLQYQRFKL